MKQDKNYLSAILIVAATGFSLFIIMQNFFTKTNERGVSAGLPLMIPTLALIIPLAIIITTMISREVRYKKALANGVKSVGLIRKVTETGKKYSRKLEEVKLELDVLEQNGSKFLGEVTTVIRYAELEFLKEGEPVPVIYKLDNKEKISIDRKPNVNELKDRINNYKTQKNMK